MTARIVIDGVTPDLTPISTVWPTVVEALPSAELEHHDGIRVKQAA